MNDQYAKPPISAYQRLIRERNEARSERDQYLSELGALRRERDALLAQRDTDGIALSDFEADRSFCRAEIERLTAERDSLQAKVEQALSKLNIVAGSLGGDAEAAYDILAGEG